MRELTCPECQAELVHLTNVGHCPVCDAPLARKYFAIYGQTWVPDPKNDDDRRILVRATIAENAEVILPYQLDWWSEEST
jgi:hypothetical protein